MSDPCFGTRPTAYDRNGEGDALEVKAVDAASPSGDCLKIGLGWFGYWGKG